MLAFSDFNISDAKGQQRQTTMFKVLTMTFHALKT